MDRGNSAAPGPASAAPPITAPAKPTTILPAPSPSTSSYDVSIGAGVDANGFANLPLRSGARRYFVSSATGSDGNGCSGAQQPGTPLRSISAAAACLQDGSGDQLLLAERTSYAAGLPNMTGRSGYSPGYPTVVQTYDPLDPANEAKYGRATGSNRPVVNTGAGDQMFSGGPGTSPRYIAIRGFDINPGNLPGMSIALLPNATGANEYILIENNIFRHTMLAVDHASSSAGPAKHLVVRNNSFYGQWHETGHAQGIYIDNWANYTLEDNVFWHNGWKVGASRDDTAANGGPTIFRRSIYAQANTSGIVRRNLISDGAADGGSLRGDVFYTENLVIDCPIGVGVGGGVGYNVTRPTGVNLEVSYNAFLGDADINSSNPRGIGITSTNGRPGSSAHHNLWVRARNPNGVNNYTFITQADFNQPSYMDFHSNVAFGWASAGQTRFSGGSFPVQDFPTYSSNVWDAETSGTNINNASVSLPSPYTAAQLYAALGYADKQAFISYAINHPEAQVQRQARARLFAGYGLQ